MRSAALALLYGAATVAALSIRRDAPQLIPDIIPDLLPAAIPSQAPNGNIPIFVTRTWPLLTPEQALTSLHKKATATPSAVSLLPGLVFPTDLPSLAHDIGTVVGGLTDGFLEDAIENPTHKQSAQAPAKQNAGSDKHVAEMTEDVSTKSSSKSSASTKNTLQTCSNPQVRPEWRNMSDQNKAGYVNAIKCLMNKPSKSNLPGTQNRYDDLVAVHQHLNMIIHNVGQFLPWHRYYLHIFYAMLKGECGYKGPLPWWDETKDAGNFNAAPPFTQQYEGYMPDLPPTVCITSGVFANHVCNIGPGDSNEPHCLARGVNETMSAVITMNFVNTCNSYTDFNDMQECQFLGVHGYCHDAVGGVMSDVQTSPGDPAFFLHHAFVDRNWRVWQATDPNSRTYAIGGSTTQNCGNNCQATTLSYVLNSLGLSKQITLDQVMDTQGGYLCYHYDY